MQRLHAKISKYLPHPLFKPDNQTYHNVRLLTLRRRQQGVDGRGGRVSLPSAIWVYEP